MLSGVTEFREKQCHLLENAQAGRLKAARVTEAAGQGLPMSRSVARMLQIESEAKFAALLGISVEALLAVSRPSPRQRRASRSAA